MDTTVTITLNDELQRKLFALTKKSDIPSSLIRLINRGYKNEFGEQDSICVVSYFEKKERQFFNLMKSWISVFPDGKARSLSQVATVIRKNYKNCDRIPNEGDIFNLSQALSKFDPKSSKYDVLRGNINIHRICHRLPLREVKFKDESEVIDGLQMFAIRNRSKRTKYYWVEQVG